MECRECGPAAFCPCRELAKAGVDVDEDATLAGTTQRARYDASRRRICIQPGMSHADTRATLAHELVHTDLGDERRRILWWDIQQEETARTLAARMLIDVRDLAVMLAVSITEREAAQRLDVDVSTLRRRVQSLTEDERTYVEQIVERITRG